MTTNLEWTKVYHGLSHLNGIPDSHQITMTDLGSCVAVYMLHRQGAHPFTAMKEAVAPTVDEAKKIAESWAESL